MIKIDVKTAEFLLKAYEAFRDDNKLPYWEDIPKYEIYYYIQLVTESDDLLKAYQELKDFLGNPNQQTKTVPDVELLTNELDDFRKEQDSQKKAELRNKFLYDERILRAKQIKLFVEAQEKLKIPTTTPEVANQVAALRESAQKEPLGFKDIVIKEIETKQPNLSREEIVNSANVFIKVLETTPIALAVEVALANPKSKLIKDLIPDLEQPEDQEQTRKSLQKVYQEGLVKTEAAKGVLSNIFSKEIVEALIPEEIFTPQEFKVTTTPPKNPAVLVNAVKIIETTNPSKPREITAQSFENLFTSTEAPVPVTTPSEISPVASSPFEVAFVPFAAKIAIPKIAKDDPETATAQTLYYELGLTESNFRTVARGTGLTNLEINKFEEKLAQYEKAHSFMAATLAAQDVGLTPQLERIRKALSTNPAERYESVAALVPPVTGLQGFFLRAGQQLAGKQITNWFEGSIRNNLAKFAGMEIAKKAKEAVAGSVIGKVAGTVFATFTGGVGAVGNWLLSKAMVGFRSNSGKILAGSGAILGFIAGGPVGALVGAGIGAGIGGVDWKKYAQYALVAIGALLTAFLGAIAIPLIIAFVGIPILIALILFIINSGAYVVPPANLVATYTGPVPEDCPSIWPTAPFNEEGSLVITQGPFGKFSHIADITGSRGEEAIDVGTGPGHPAIATHKGVALAVNEPGAYGKEVRVRSTCNGKEFESLYAHLSSVEINTGDQVTKGQEVGKTGNSGAGAMGAYHLHYEFRPPNSYKYYFAKSELPVLMEVPYVPKAVPNGCTLDAGNLCNVTIP